MGDGRAVGEFACFNTKCNRFCNFVFNVITNMQQHKVIDFAMMMWCI
jgi:hypothetical protein